MTSVNFKPKYKLALEALGISMLWFIAYIAIILLIAFT